MRRVTTSLTGRLVCAAAVIGLSMTAAATAAESSTRTPAARQAPPVRRSPGAATPDSQAAVEGRKLFLAVNCYGCHGGLAGGAMGPSLRDTVWEAGGSDADIYRSISDGHPDHGMPPWKGRLSPGQIRSLVAYIRSLRTPAEPTFFWAEPAGR